MVNIFSDKSSESFDWIDLLDPTKEELKEIATKYNLHYLSVQDSLQPEHLPKHEIIDDILFIILRIYDPECKHKSATIQELTRKLAIFIGKDFIITIHRSDQKFLKDIKIKCIDTDRCNDMFEVLDNIIKTVFLSYQVPGVLLSEELDSYESDIFLKEKMPLLLRKLYVLKRKSTVIDRILHLSRDIIHHLENKISGPRLQDLKDLFINIETSYSQLIENSNNLMNLYISISSQKTNEVVRVLTIFSVFFMPLTFIAGIYGMNFDYMPELRMKLGYPGVIGFMILLTLVIYFWFRRKGWL